MWPFLLTFIAIRAALDCLAGGHNSIPAPITKELNHARKLPESTLPTDHWFLLDMHFAVCFCIYSCFQKMYNSLPAFWQSDIENEQECRCAGNSGACLSEPAWEHTLPQQPQNKMPCYTLSHRQDFRWLLCPSATFCCPTICTGWVPGHCVTSQEAASSSPTLLPTALLSGEMLKSTKICIRCHFREPSFLVSVKSTNRKFKLSFIYIFKKTYRWRDCSLFSSWSLINLSSSSASLLRKRKEHFCVEAAAFK